MKPGTAKRQRKPGKVKGQAERFTDAAREHEADETGKTFEKAFGKLVPPKRFPKAGGKR